MVEENGNIVAKATVKKLKGPGEKADSSVVVEVGKLQAPDTTEMILTVFYLLYKANFISRINLKQILRITKEPAPNSMAEYLAGEAAKA